MRIRSEQEALYVACRMEAAAIQLYTRALSVLQGQGRTGDPLYAHLTLTLADEQEHLRRFSALYTGLDAQQERQLELSAVAEGILFEGGLMGAAREGLLRDAQSMLTLAARAEEASAAKYRAFAQATQGPARETLLTIAREEERHLAELRQQGAEKR